MAPFVYVVEYNSAEFVFHYSLWFILLFYLNIHPKLTQHNTKNLVFRNATNSKVVGF